MGNVYASEYNNWNNRLNAVRSKHYLATIPYTAVRSGIDKTTSVQMSTLRTNMITTANQASRIPDVSTYDIGDVNVGAKILLATNSKINVILSNMESICIYNSSDDNYDRMDWDDDSSYDSNYDIENGGSDICDSCQDDRSYGN